MKNGGCVRYSQTRYFESIISEIFFNITRIRRNDESKIDSRRKANETIAIRFLNEGISPRVKRERQNRIDGQFLVGLISLLETFSHFFIHLFIRESKKEFSNTKVRLFDRMHGLYVKSTTLYNRKNQCSTRPFILGVISLKSRTNFFFYFIQERASIVFIQRGIQEEERRIRAGQVIWVEFLYESMKRVSREEYSRSSVETPVVGTKAWKIQQPRKTLARE